MNDRVSCRLKTQSPSTPSVPREIVDSKAQQYRSDFIIALENRAARPLVEGTELT